MRCRGGNFGKVTLVSMVSVYAVQSLRHFELPPSILEAVPRQVISSIKGP